MEVVRYKRGISQVVEDDSSSEEDHAPKQGTKSARTSLGGERCETCSEASPMPSAVVLKAWETMEALEEHLTCDLCAALFLQPVTLSGCGHTFCGSCLKYWIRSNIYDKQKSGEFDWACPTCRRNPLTTAHPSILIRKLCDVFLQYHPELTRREEEAAKAAQAYKGNVITFPDETWRPPSPPPSTDDTRPVWQPCNWCYWDEGWSMWRADWHCPIPVPVLEDAVNIDGPIPEGHFLCSQCEFPGPTNGPETVTCNVCQELRCRKCEDTCWCPPAGSAAPLDHHQSGRRDPASYYGERYWQNRVERRRADTIFDILHGDTKAIVIYQEIYKWANSPAGQAEGGFASLLSPYAEAIKLPFVKDYKMTQPDGRRSRICNFCCELVIGAGLFGWMRRTLDELEDDDDPELLEIKALPRCPYGFTCIRQHRSISHAESFSHIDPATETMIAESNDDMIHIDDVFPPLPRTERHLLHDRAPTSLIPIDS